MTKVRGRAGTPGDPPGRFISETSEVSQPAYYLVRVTYFYLQLTAVAADVGTVGQPQAHLLPDLQQ